MNKRKAVYVSTVLMIALLVSGFACNKTKVATASRDIAASVKAFQTAEISLHQQGRISLTEHIKIQQYLKAVATAGKTVDSCVKQTSAVTCVDAGLQATSNLLSQGVIPIKDVTTNQQLQLAVGVITTGFNTLKGLL